MFVLKWKGSEPNLSEAPFLCRHVTCTTKTVRRHTYAHAHTHTHTNIHTQEGHMPTAYPINLHTDIICQNTHLMK